ncbi:MAG TPA: hypothetical protein VN643_08870 [Pyrinomonadaceae bacterium]|nr:hypothetical protein [Pyrinomonadaceae bacterium]
MITLRETREKIAGDPEWWAIHLMNFVDDFRYHKRIQAIEEPFIETNDARMDSLVAATAESLCDELNLETPAWLAQIPDCEEPWFVSGFERLKAITIVESPLRFRMRKIFVQDNFLSRV